MPHSELKSETKNWAGDTGATSTNHRKISGKWGSDSAIEITHLRFLHKGDRDNDDQPAHLTPSVQPIQPRPETKTQKTPENVKPDTNVKSDPSSTDVPQAKQSVPQEEQGVTQEKQKPGRRDLWKEAYEDLDPDDKKYVPASGSRRASDSTSRAAINGVIEDTKARYTEWKNGGLRIGGNNGGINIRDYTERIVNAALKASDLISMFVSFDPTGHASSAWTVISFGMSVVGNSLDRRDAIFQASDYLSEKLAYYSLIDANYRNQGVGSDHQLDETLLDVYKAILRFTVDVKKAQDESAASRVARSVFPLTDQPLAQLKQAITEQGAVAEKWTYLASDLEQGERSQVVWLSATDYSRHHRELQDKRTGDTGRWLLNSKEYIDWKYNSGGLLWLPGISGCGKSVLCSTIIQDIQEECEADDAKYLAYWYFEFGDNKTQSVNSMTRSLVRQLSRSPLLPSVTKLCQEYEIKGGEPGSKEINGLFNDMVSSVPGNIYLIFDALDECPENGDSQERETLLRFLQDLLAQHRNKVHILATSRLEQDIKEELGPVVSSTIDLEAYLAEDVKIFVMETMKQSRFKGLSADIKELIEEKLLNSQERRFRWAELQMAAIRKLHVEEDIKKALDTIPRTLEETYMRILNEIEPVNVPLARKILMAICTSHMGLSLDMVADIVGVKSPDSVIEICTTGLISSFDEIVRVAHFSVQEFLVIPEGHSVLPHLECQFSAMDGSRFLATSMVDCLLKQTTVLTPKEALENPFFVHAARYWNIYVAALRDSDPLWCDLQPKVNRLFTEPELYLNWTYVLDFYSQNLPFEYANIHFGNPENQPIQVASRMGFAQTVEELLDRGADTEAIGGASYSPYALCVASGEGHEAVVRILLNRGANVNTGEEQQSTALIAASRGGHKRIVQILLDHGADINTEGSKHGSALNAASEMGHEDIVKLLLDAGASISPQRSRYGALTAASWAGHEHIVQMILDYIKDIDAQGMEFANSLEAAAANNHQGIVKKLLDRATDLNGPNVCGQTDGNPPIFAAAKYGNDEVMKLLVDRGADLNVHAQDGRTLLEFAMDQGRERVVKVILDNGADVNVPKSYELLSTAIVFKNERLVDMILNHGADINARGLSGRTALAIAAWSGLERIVEMLLNRGAKIDWNGPGSPLAMASSEGNERIVQMLLERGGEVDLEALNSSLVKALKRGQVKMVRMLLERGADINLRAIENALIDASSRGHESLVQLLLERGADVNQFDGERGSALTAASLGGHEEIVQLLLERGADVNQVDEVRRSNLIAASFGGNEKIVQILLERGVDVNLCDEGDNGALQCAAYRGSESIVQILLDHGAKIDCVGSIGSALQLAASEGHEDIVKLLLDRGADVNLQGGELESAIQEASSNGYDEIAQLLRERGAELNENWE
ncbi:hypothetical protein N7528_004191 [Penicillium herquei]|nr:hypothetical protein N7528_004191 [Penicillium herquei]